ncbi:hypothetical protein [Aeromonas hydrophila]|uniref:hypothetical protein n=1 Tax=Aeromonas hydrophila TaxID=644 RepID=UPI0039778FB8
MPTPLIRLLPMSEQLVAPLYSLEHGGHFLDRDGFLELPLVHDRLLGMIEDQ